ncbi:MAG: T9SS type A sorting domain-containing protein [bacterium]|nr:MAG: T9SS type A sorting domain-containing protein [bacterium]
MDPNTGLVQGTPSSGQVGSYTVVIIVDDGRGGISNQTYTLHVLGPNGIDPLAGQIPTEFIIFQNYPNPFNPVTHIRYGVPQTASVKIDLFNSLGQKVTELVNEQKSAGYYMVDFDASHLASGIYFYRIYAGSYQKIMKMMLMK